MSRYLGKEIEAKIDKLAYYQIAGGILGIGIVIWFLAQTTVLTGLLLVLTLFATALYSFSIYCGNHLRKKKDLKFWLKLSLLNQILQTVNIAIPGYVYKFEAGLAFIVSFDFTEKLKFSFNFSLGSFQFHFATDDNFIRVGFNLAAFLVIYYIVNLQEEIEERSLLIDETSLNELKSPNIE